MYRSLHPSPIQLTSVQPTVPPSHQDCLPSKSGFLCLLPTAAIEDTESECESTDEDTTDSGSSSSVSAWPSAPNTPDREGVISLVIDAARRQLVDRLMVEFHTLLNQNMGIGSHTESPRSPNSQTPRSSPSNPSNQGSNNNQKRQRGKGGLDAPKDDENEDRGNKRLERVASSLPAELRMFACPYYRRNPRNHKKYRSCAGAG
jgi:hypothetical protein